MVLTLIALAAAAAGATPPPADPLSRIRCLREVETGSLMRGRKVCKTEREWRALHNETAREAQGILTAPTPQSTSG